MLHSYNKIWIHAIFGTKNRQSFIQPKIENEIHDFIRKELREQGCPVRTINGTPDHIHCLFLLNPKKSINEVLKQIIPKGFINWSKDLKLKISKFKAKKRRHILSYGECF